MPKYQLWTGKKCEIPGLYDKMLNETHILIAGATGSGKSVMINGLIYAILGSGFPHNGPDGMQMILCDPKKVELSRYEKLPHVLQYADTIPGILNALETASNIMENRFQAMKSRGMVETDRGHIYVIIDEFADLMLNCKPSQIKVIQHIAELGRAAHIHLILATQAPNRKVITANIAVNMTCHIALRCHNRIESRQIINRNGAELLPKYGKCLYISPDTDARYIVHMVDKAVIDEMCAHWIHQVYNPEYVYTGNKITQKLHQISDYLKRPKTS